MDSEHMQPRLVGQLVPEWERSYLTLLTRAWQSRWQEVQTPRSSLNRARRRAPPLDRVQNFPSHSALNRQ